MEEEVDFELLGGKRWQENTRSVPFDLLTRHNKELHVQDQTSYQREKDLNAPQPRKELEEKINQSD